MSILSLRLLADGFTRPIGLAILGVSLVLGASMALLPAFDSVFGRAIWMVVLGLVAYVVIALVLAAPTRTRRSRQSKSAPGDAALSSTSATITGLNTATAQDELSPRLVEQALRHLNEPATLARCELVSTLEATLNGVRGRGGPQAGEPTPLELAQTLRTVLIEAIDRLNPGDVGATAVTTKGLQYWILREEYVQGLATKQIIVRHGIGDATFHRRRREEVQALTEELLQQELRARRSVLEPRATLLD